VYLKELNYTDFNSHVTKIKRLITNDGPPMYTQEEYNELYYLFVIIDEIFISIKPDKYISRRYYPYNIRRSIEHVYRDRPQIRDKIIYNIHIQEPDTVYLHDQIWKQICEKSNGKLIYTDTQKITYINE
jgi:hypothetical protein